MLVTCIISKKSGWQKERKEKRVEGEREGKKEEKGKEEVKEEENLHLRCRVYLLFLLNVYVDMWF